MATFDLVFEGGGAKCFAFAGALAALADAGHTHQRLVGTSGGAVTATLTAAGYQPAELLAAISEQFEGRPRFLSFLDPPHSNDFSNSDLDRSATGEFFERWRIPGRRLLDRALLRLLLNGPLYRQLFLFVENGGFYAGAVIHEWVRERLAAKGMSPDVTFAEFHAHTGADLSLVVADSTEMEMLVLNHRTAPDCPVAWGARMSLSIPFLWREVLWDGAWGLYRGRVKEGHAMIDGGALSNFPLWLVNTDPAHDPFVQDVMGDTPADRAGNLGLFLNDHLPVPNAPPPPLAVELVTNQFRTGRRLTRVIDTVLLSRDIMAASYHPSEVCHLPVQGYSTTEFGMTDERRAALVAAGHEAMRQHLAQHFAAVEQSVAHTAS
ncbi:MAG: patatin-like phospholipase family protein [Pyrinomonadaceae bacterium]